MHFKCSLLLQCILFRFSFKILLLKKTKIYLCNYVIFWQSSLFGYFWYYNWFFMAFCLQWNREFESSLKFTNFVKQNIDKSFQLHGYFGNFFMFVFLKFINILIVFHSQTWFTALNIDTGYLSINSNWFSFFILY